jgi:hypothetical protein
VNKVIDARLVVTQNKDACPEHIRMRLKNLNVKYAQKESIAMRTMEELL